MDGKRVKPRIDTPSIKIAIDLTPLLKHRTGVDVYMMELARHLVWLEKGHSLTFLANWEDRPMLHRLLNDRCTIIPISFRSRAARLIALQAVVPALLALRGTQVVHNPSFFMPLLRGKAKHVITVHDMTSFSMPQHHIPLRRSPPYLKLLAASVRRADRICVPSRAVHQELQQYFPEVNDDRIRVIPHGVGEEFRPPSAEQISATHARLRIEWPYILYVGTLASRKNLPHLLESYKRLICNGAIVEHLVLAGMRESGSPDLLRKLESLELRGRVHLLGYVRKEDLPPLYGGARLFVYPSFNEGFGLPPFESMACGVPAIVSDAPAFTENLSGAAEIVPVSDAEALTCAMGRLLLDSSLHERRREAGLERVKQFCWRRTAAETMRCYEELAGKC
jgi:glycosyltransferase involved in cell wall biosynthesis